MEVGIVIAIIVVLVVGMNMFNSIANHRAKMEDDPTVEHAKKRQSKIDDVLENQQLNRPSGGSIPGSIAHMNAKLGYDIRDEHIARERSKHSKDKKDKS